jgi:hypothetical protein
MITTLLTAWIALTPVAADQAAPATRPMDLSALRPGHPRLIILEQDLERVRRLIADEPAVRQLRDELHREAEKILSEPPVVHELIGPRLLHQSRRCLGRVYLLAGLYRLEGDRRFAQRAEKEMLTAADFSDWNPSHFLDTAEMTHALAVGYDWLHDVLPAESRERIRTAIIEKGLKPSLRIYRENGWWARSMHNWNQVCNGGMAIGALAVADEQPELAGYILGRAAESIRLPTARLAPDGGWDEGPGYWNYALSYTAYYLAAMRTALGTDFGLSDFPGLAETGLFRIYSIGPTGQTFNYADAGAGAGNAPQMFFFSRLFDRPVYAWHQRQHRNGAHVLDLLWYDPRGTKADLKRLPLDVHFKNVDVVFFRSAWNDPDAFFVGFKGGDNKANHSHLDLGTFVFEAQGQRWAVDLGPDDYNLPAYFGNQRWTYYRLRTEGQNTLVINGQNQNPKAKAPIIEFESREYGGYAIADLSAAYAEHARRVWRGVALYRRGGIVIQDEVEADGPLDIEWNLHTTAEVEVDGRDAVLSLAGQRMRAHVLGPVEAEWQVSDLTIEAPQRPARNTRKLVYRFKSDLPATRFAIRIVPDRVSSDLVAHLEPLSSWKSSPKTKPFTEGP